MTYFGPFDITGSTVDTGKVEVFSWAQWQLTTGDGSPDSGTEVDSVLVQAANAEALIVNSPYGSPSPAIRVNDMAIDSLVTASVETVNDLPGTRRIPTGWQGTGSVPSLRTTNSVTFTLSLFSMIQWKWRTEYQLSVSATPGGTVASLGSQYLPDGTPVSVTPTAAPGYIFQGWDGASASLNTNITVVLSKPVTLLARFAADADTDGLADESELANFGNLAQGPNDDADADGSSD